METTLYEDNTIRKFKFKNPISSDKLDVDETWSMNGVDVHFKTFEGEHQLPEFQTLLEAELSEPYTVFTYRYFWVNNPKLTVLAYVDGKCIGVVISKVDNHEGRGIYPERDSRKRGYIGMLAVDPSQRGRRIGSRLVEMAIELMWASGAHDIVLDAESTNEGALRLYTSLGFVKTKKLPKYYLSNSDAFRLKLVRPMTAETPLSLNQEIRDNLFRQSAVMNHADQIGTNGLSFALPKPGGRLCTFTRAGIAAMEERLGRKVHVAMETDHHGHGGHSHSHGGKPCTGHGGESAPRRHVAPPSHEHSHGGKPCTGHGGESAAPRRHVAPPSHEHSHGGKPCTGHGGETAPRRHVVPKEPVHTHTHGGAPCSGH